MIQVKADGSLEKGNGGDKNWSNSGYILKVAPT